MSFINIYLLITFALMFFHLIFRMDSIFHDLITNNMFNLSTNMYSIIKKIKYLMRSLFIKNNILDESELLCLNEERVHNIVHLQFSSYVVTKRR